jgi:hypothetical protein
MSKVIEGFLFSVCVACLVIFIVSIGGCNTTQPYNGDDDAIAQKCVRDGHQLRGCVDE